jgi:hypothetical protein
MQHFVKSITAVLDTTQSCDGIAAVLRKHVWPRPIWTCTRVQFPPRDCVLHSEIARIHSLWEARMRYGSSWIWCFTFLMLSITSPPNAPYSCLRVPPSPRREPRSSDIAMLWRLLSAYSTGLLMIYLTNLLLHRCHRRTLSRSAGSPRGLWYVILPRAL